MFVAQRFDGTQWLDLMDRIPTRVQAERVAAFWRDFGFQTRVTLR